MEEQALLNMVAVDFEAITWDSIEPGEHKFPFALKVCDELTKSQTITQKSKTV